MGKRIRHLEFYGYVDQNVYMGIPNVDLSDIREVNKEQDEDINAISSATKDKADLVVVNELSGKVDTFIDKQSRINKHFLKEIHENEEDIRKLKKHDKQVISKINEIADNVNSINDSVESISGTTGDINTRLEQHIEEASSFSADTKAELERLKDVKISKEKANETFAKKDDVYTKDDVDGFISGITSEYATKEWVNEGFITKAEANETFATKDDVSGLNTDIQEISSNLSSYEETTNDNIETISGNVSQNTSDIETISGKVLQNTSDIETISGKVSQNTSDIETISGNVSQNTSDLEALGGRVTSVEEKKADKSYVDGKVTALNNDLSSIRTNINNINNEKADKEYADRISGAVEVVKSDLDELSGRISSANTRIDVIREENLGRDEKISGLTSGLTQEREAREKADRDIIGYSDDVESDNTIIGAKRYADNVSNQALLGAKVNTDNKCNEVVNYVDSAVTRLNEAIWAKADKTYVNESTEELIRTEDAKISEEAERAKEEESRIENLIKDVRYKSQKRDKEISSTLTHTANIVKALTSWDGDDKVDYIDSGNGIVDVMHREMHDIKEAISAITVIGEGVVTNNQHEVAFGRYNESHTGPNDADKSIFEIGIGTNTFERKNAFEIRKNGDVYMWVEGEYMKINDLLGMLAHETY